MSDQVRERYIYILIGAVAKLQAIDLDTREYTNYTHTNSDSSRLLLLLLLLLQLLLLVLLWLPLPLLSPLLLRSQTLVVLAMFAQT